MRKHDISYIDIYLKVKIQYIENIFDTFIINHSRSYIIHGLPNSVFYLFIYLLYQNIEHV